MKHAHRWIASAVVAIVAIGMTASPALAKQGHPLDTHAAEKARVHPMDTANCAQLDTLCTAPGGTVSTSQINQPECNGVGPSCGNETWYIAGSTPGYESFGYPPLPSGVTWSFSPAVTTGTQFTTLTLNIASTVPPGQYQFSPAADCPTALFPCINLGFWLWVKAPASTTLNLGCKRCTVGDPIDPTTGNLYEEEVDFNSRIGNFPLRIVRSYNSQSPQRGIFGNNWSSNLDASLIISGTSASAIMPNGQQLPFTYNGSAWVAASSVTTTMTANRLGYLITTVDQDQYQFNGSGQLISETNAYGDSLNFSYGATTMTVLDNYGNQMLVTINGGLVNTISVMGQTFTYDYDPAGTGNLFNVQFVVNGDNVSRQYLYEDPSFPHAMTGLIDETQQRYSTWGYDSNGRAQSSILGPVTAQADSTTINYSQLTSTKPHAQVLNANKLQTNYYMITGNDGQTLVPEINVLASATVPEEWYYTVFDQTLDLPVTITDWDAFDTTYTYFPITPSDGRSLPKVVNSGQFGNTPQPTQTMSQITVSQWDPVFPEPKKATLTGTNISGTMVDYQLYAATYDGINGRIQSVTETDLTNYTVPYASNMQPPRTWGYQYSYWPNIGNGHSAVETETITGPLQDVTTLNFDQYGRLSQTIDASNHTFKFGQFTTQGLPQQITDSSNNGVVTWVTYNERNQVTSVTRAFNTSEATTLSIQYYDNGPVKQVTLPDGYYLHYDYDDAMHLIGVTDSAGGVQTITPNSLNGEWQTDSVTSTQSSASYQLSRTFDDLGRVISVLDSSPEDGGARTISYTTDNQVTDTKEGSLTTRNPTEIGTVYDTLNRIYQIGRPPVQKLAQTSSKVSLSVDTTILYGETGHIGQIKDGRGLVTNYTFDGLGDLMTIQSPDTGLTEFWPDAAGNVWKRLDQKGNLLIYTHDNLSRVIKVEGQTPQQGSPQQLTTFTYDQTDSAHTYGYGHLTSMTDESGTTDWAYDMAGHVVSKTQVTGTLKLTTSYTYWPGTDDIETITVLSSVTNQSYTLTYSWSNGQISSISSGTKSLVSSMSYQPFGGPLQWTLGNGEIDQRYYDYYNRPSADPVNSYVGYDTGFSGLHVQQETMSGSLSGSLNGQYQFTEDNYGHVTGLSGSLTTSTGTKNVPTLAYLYDPDDNRLTSKSGATQTKYTLSTTSNQIASTTVGTTTTSEFYDLNGSLTGIGTNGQETYDVQGRLSQYGSNDSYLYNGRGERVEKSLGSTPTVFLYDEQGRLIAEYNGSTGVLIHEIVYAGDMPVAVLTPKAIYYVHADYRNTPRQIDDSSTNVVWVWDTKVYGDNAPNQNPSGKGAFVFNLRFPGQYYDAESGNFYNYFRDYNPSLGRYVESDPLGLAAGVNTYAYVQGNPLGNIDPLGLAWVYVWLPQGGNMWGHSSLKLDGGDYISWWPDSPRTPNKNGGQRCGCMKDNNYHAPPHTPGMIDFQFDVLNEGHRQPTFSIYISGLDEAAIHNWWQSFKDNNQWDATKQNCSTTVYDALRAGGALPSNPVVWSPGAVAAYSIETAIQQSLLERVSELAP